MRTRSLATLLTCVGLLGVACSGDDETGASGGQGGAAGGGGSAGGGAGGVGGDPWEFAAVERSCVYDCPGAPTSCAESTTPYACQNLDPWDAIPHAEACPAWDGTFPSITGQCTVSQPTGDAALYAGADPADANRIILPDGRPLAPAGVFTLFTEPDMRADITTGMAVIPGTSLVATINTGSAVHGLRLIDTDLIGQAGAVRASVVLPRGDYLNAGAVFVAPDRLYVAGAGRVEVFLVDTAAGTLTRDETLAIPLPTAAGNDELYASGVEVTPSGRHLLVTSVNDRRLFVLDLDAASYGAVVGSLEVGALDAHGVWMDPFDATGTRAWVALISRKQVVEVLLTDPAVPALGHVVATDENPQAVAFLDARWMAVANNLGETITLVDRTAGTGAAVPVDFEAGLPGLDLTSLAWDATASRLYATLAGVNAIAAYDVDLGVTPPALTHAGRLPAGWWPSAVAVRPDGDLVVTSMRGRGAGPVPDHTQEDTQRAGVQRVEAPSATDLTAGEATVAAIVDRAGDPGAPRITCPSGATPDFPVPATNTEGPSPRIRYVFYVVRENKTFDGVFGDLPGVVGDPSLTLKPSAVDMDLLWGNLRRLAQDFSNADNSYTDADASSQGHGWNTYGRTTDFCERWALSDARLLPGCGVTTTTRPVEGSVFDWLGQNDVSYTILGEIVGAPTFVPAGAIPADGSYPGGPFQSIGYPDHEKACYIAGRARVRCDLPSFSFITFPNDHGQGVDPGTPSPELMMAVNDEATGMLVDAISHSPIWAESLIIVTEDDPQQGGDHVDYHRVPTVFISPWVRRGYVSKTHISVSSTHKIFAHVFGKPYPNLQTRLAALPLDLFTSTPDFTPWEYTPRTYPVSCGAGASAAERELASLWDYTNVDDQPGLDAQIERWLRGEQLQTLTPEHRAMVHEQRRRAERRRELGWPEDD